MQPSLSLPGCACHQGNHCQLQLGLDPTSGWRHQHTALCPLAEIFFFLCPGFSVGWGWCLQGSRVACKGLGVQVPGARLSSSSVDKGAGVTHGLGFMQGSKPVWWL